MWACKKGEKKKSNLSLPLTHTVTHSYKYVPRVFNPLLKNSGSLIMVYISLHQKWWEFKFQFDFKTRYHMVIFQLSNINIGIGFTNPVLAGLYYQHHFPVIWMWLRHGKRMSSSHHNNSLVFRLYLQWTSMHCMYTAGGRSFTVQTIAETCLAVFLL